MVCTMVSQFIEVDQGLVAGLLNAVFVSEYPHPTNWVVNVESGFKYSDPCNEYIPAHGTLTFNTW